MSLRAASRVLIAALLRYIIVDEWRDTMMARYEEPLCLRHYVTRARYARLVFMIRLRHVDDVSYGADVAVRRCLFFMAVYLSFRRLRFSQLDYVV